MSSKTETGHAKNVANFSQLEKAAESFGDRYNPSTEIIALSNVQSYKVECRDILAQVRETKTAFNNAVNARAKALAELGPFSTKVLNTFKASNVPKAAVEDARGYVRKMRGERVVKIVKIEPVPGEAPLTAEEKQDKHHSAAQTSVDNKLAHFSDLVSTVSSQTNYSPNEAEFSVPELNEVETQMNNLNDDAVTSYTNWLNARILRDNKLYNAETGLKRRADMIKNYISAVYGATSPEFRHVSGIQILEIVRKK